MSRFAVVLCLVVAALTIKAGATGNAKPLQYELNTVIEPAAGTVAVDGTVVVAVEGKPAQVNFGLHRAFVIDKLIIAGRRANFSYQDIAPTPFNPATRTVIVELSPGAVRDGKIRLSIAYKGKLEQLPEWGSAPDQKWAMDDQVNARLVQLANYSSWYPQFGPFGCHFRSDLEVSLPKGWTAVSGGAKRDIPSSSGRSVTRWSVPDNFDLVVSAAPNFQIVARRAGGTRIEIYHTQMPDAVVMGEADKLAATMTWFKQQLGEPVVPGDTIRHVYAPMKHGQGRAGIARAGEIVTSEGRVLDAMTADPDYTLFQDIAHEIAHFWWHFGSGQGDWVNEAFAEYFSALAVKSLVSEDEFEAALAHYRKGVAGLSTDAPSLASVPREGGQMVWTVRYQKGSLMLDDFRRRMGDAAFVSAARAFFQTYKNGNVGTAEFRAFWSDRLGDRTYVDAWLESKGGLPALP